MSDYIVLIPARGGSKRILKKNIYNLGNKPLIYYSIKMGLDLGYPTYVSTDSEEIAYISSQIGAKIIMRPHEFALDTSLDIDWIFHALKCIDSSGKEKIIFLRPTTPFRNINVVMNGITSFISKFTSLRSVEPLSEAIEKMMWIKNGDLVSVALDANAHILSNQNFDVSYKPNGYLDILKSDFILSGTGLYGDKIQPLITNRVPEIDVIEDFEYAEYFGRKHGYITNTGEI
jgi:CMP-N,N'-diacetyllegionaminic acid synthase